MRDGCGRGSTTVPKWQTNGFEAFRQPLSIVRLMFCSWWISFGTKLKKKNRYCCERHLSPSAIGMSSPYYFTQLIASFSSHQPFYLYTHFLSGIAHSICLAGRRCNTSTIEFMKFTGTSSSAFVVCRAQQNKDSRNSKLWCIFFTLRQRAWMRVDACVRTTQNKKRRKVKMVVND